MKIIKTNYNIDNKFNKKIVLISDIHYKNKIDIDRLNYILNNIKKINPDYICISGDIIDKSKIKDEDCLINWLTKLSSINKVIASLGNHEYYVDKKNNIYELNKNLLNKILKIKNLYLLDNKSVVLDNINFTGVNLPIDLYDKGKYYEKEVIKFINNIIINKANYNILLMHSPLNIQNEEITNKFNLILCGHTHGGVVLKIFRPIFKNNGFISPNKKLFPKNVYGNIKINNSYIIISSGLSVTPFKFINRFFYPEIVIIKI